MKNKHYLQQWIQGEPVEVYDPEQGRWEALPPINDTFCAPQFYDWQQFRVMRPQLGEHALEVLHAAGVSNAQWYELDQPTQELLLEVIQAAAQRSDRMLDEMLDPTVPDRFLDNINYHDTKPHPNN